MTRNSEDFKYVDVRHTTRTGKESAWIRMPATDVTKWAQETAGNFNCFATVQRFAAEKRTKGEPFTAPLYFDLDNKEDPSISQADGIKLVEFFVNELGVELTDIWIYFSGSKGFHILINSHALGIQPATDLHRIYKHIAGYLVHRLDLISLDLVVYTSSRMLRMPNSMHQSTDLYKIELSLEEMKTLTLGQIRELAKSPRPLDDAPYTISERREKVELRAKAALFVQDKASEYEESAKTDSERYSKDEYVFRKGQPPACVVDIMEGGWKKQGDRNNATVQLAC